MHLFDVSMFFNLAEVDVQQEQSLSDYVQQDLSIVTIRSRTRYCKATNEDFIT
jgi:hypothetical protein